MNQITAVKVITINLSWLERSSDKEDGILN